MHDSAKIVIARCDLALHRAESFLRFRRLSKIMHQENHVMRTALGDAEHYDVSNHDFIEAWGGVGEAE